MSEEKITIVVRLIRSFAYRNVKNMILKDIDTTITIKDLKIIIKNKIFSESAFVPHRTKNYDTLKLYTHAHGHKPDCLVINLDKDDTQILQDEKTIQESEIFNETEISFFEMEEYLSFKKNPEVKW